MPVVPVEKLMELQQNSNNVRNICILAHVDHGKTTLSDSLLASNSIISARSSGKVRYLDSRVDEQERGITMKSSGVSLYFKVLSSLSGGFDEEFLINLIDSPGHVDFSSEVSSATRVCDGALCLVDVIEGVCTQTHSVLRHAWSERLRVVLVLNKMDRLILDMQQTPLEAYNYLKKIIEQVNAIMGSLFREEQAERELLELNDPDSIYYSESDIYFDPNKGNVIFASAIDGWAFRPSQFASMYAKKINVVESSLKKVLWDDYYFDPKSKRVVGSSGKELGLKPCFVQFVLDNVWAVYSTVVLKPNFEKLEKIVQSLSIKITPRELKSKDTRVVVQAIFSQWLPIARVSLAAIIDQLPSPAKAQTFRLPKLLNSQVLPESLLQCLHSLDTPTTAYVAKMFDVSSASVVGENPNDKSLPSSLMVGFVRVFSGTLHVGQRLYVLSSKHRGCENLSDGERNNDTPTVVVKGLLLLMGREFLQVDRVAAGNICGVYGIDSAVKKAATLSTSLSCPSFGQLHHHTAPIVRVAIEPVDPANLNQLILGLKLLSQVDPVVHVSVEESGEHVISCTGELHLERCVRDLKDTFAKCEFQVSEPLIPFRECISDSPAIKQSSETSNVKVLETGRVLLTTDDYTLEVSSELLDKEEQAAVSHFSLTELASNLPSNSRLKSRIKDRTLELVCVGPRNVNTCVLVFEKSAFAQQHDDLCLNFDSLSIHNNNSSFLSSILPAFELACSRGPLCGEPVSGVLFTLHKFEVKPSTFDVQSNGEASVELAKLSGRLIAVLRETLHASLITWSMRLGLAMYRVKTRASGDVLGKIYAVLSKRKGRVVSEEMKEGTYLFDVVADIPIIESFGLAEGRVLHLS